MEYLVCAPLTHAGFLNAFSTRKGGVSDLPKDALNLSDREDRQEHVAENRRRFMTALGTEARRLVTLRQTHSDQHHAVDKQSGADLEGDALLSSSENVLLSIQTADCLPILIADPVTKFFAGIHAGWRGTLARIAQKTLSGVLSKGEVKAENLLVALGPAACGECFEVGAEVSEAFQAQFQEWPEFVRMNEDGKAMLDTTMANVLQLADLGILPENIFVSNFCTMHDNDLFFSYRKESQGGKKVVGRQMAVIGRAS